MHFRLNLLAPGILFWYYNIGCIRSIYHFGQHGHFSDTYSINSETGNLFFHFSNILFFLFLDFYDFNYREISWP